MAQSPQEPRWPTYPAGAQPPIGDAVIPAGPGLPSYGPVPQRPGYSPQDPLVLAAGGSTLRKEGVWTVPPYLRVRGDLGSIRLDFRRAHPTSPVIQLDLSGGVGTIVMVLPQGWAVQAERLVPGIGSRRIRVGEEPSAGSPVLVLSGSLGLGTLVIRHPNGRDERRLRRLLRREQRHPGETPHLR